MVFMNLYKQHVIKQYFADYFLYNSDITFDFTKGNSLQIHDNTTEPWKVTVVDTGYSTMTGGRIKRIQKYVGEETFLMTYGDGLSDVPVDKLVEFHKKSGKVATITAIQPGGRFGALDLDEGDVIHGFAEKKKEDGGWINAGYMVLEPKIFEYIEGDETVFEKEPLERCAMNGELMAYRYEGFWQCMDSMRDKEQLEKIWKSGNAPWKH